MISEFRGETKWLSNFERCSVMFEGVLYPSSENAYMASKTLDKELRKEFENLSPVEAKKLGREIPLRPDWEEIKDIMMYRVCKDKFTRNEYLKDKLISTGTKVLIEGNYWNDTYWGICKGLGKNKLGIILMEIRRELSDI